VGSALDTLLETAGRAGGAAGAKRSVPEDEFTRRLSSDGGADVGEGEDELIGGGWRLTEGLFRFDGEMNDEDDG
jgi:hypothetical protein